MSKNNQVTVLYGCDLSGNHTVDINCIVDRREKSFNTTQEAESFINECSIVHNLNDVYGEVPLELMPDIDSSLNF